MEDATGVPSFTVEFSENKPAYVGVEVTHPDVYKRQVYGYEHQHTESRFGSEQRNRLVHVTAAHTSAGWFCRTGVCNNDVYCI